ncbi:MAG TPA: peptidoglycan editing factor PgeF [Candidatus Polarisedimenticolia bacterium]|nr:peptidoglycan editing factor PgeF [Candidatus Polarisedimenticolia bacterium]
MNVFRLPDLFDDSGVACAFVGRLERPRPDPASLVSCLAPPLPPGVAVPLLTLRQIHSNRCLVVPAAGMPTEGVAGEGDALITTHRRLALGIATADCLPIIAADPEAGVLAAIHAGWRGTAARILAEALRRMVETFGARPSRIRVGVGPAVAVCCYEVGPEVADVFADVRGGAPLVVKKPGGSTHLDLLEANRRQAIENGVPASQFSSVGICTVCRPDVCHSYRREKEAAGRMWALAALA